MAFLPPSVETRIPRRITMRRARVQVQGPEMFQALREPLLAPRYRGARVPSHWRQECEFALAEEPNGATRRSTILRGRYSKCPPRGCQINREARRAARRSTRAW